MELREQDGTLSSGNIELQITKFDQEIRKLSNFLTAMKDADKKICAFGASGRANMLLHYLDLQPGTISLVFDESEERIDREMANSRIPVKKYHPGMDFNFDYCLILAWNYESVIRSKLDTKIEIIIPLPEFRVG